VIKCKIQNLTKFEYELIYIPIDTGYSGSLLVPQNIYDYFKIAELPPKYWRKYSTLTGEIVIRVSRGYLVVDNLKMEVMVESPLYSYGKFLVGREVLNKIIIILDGLRKECYLSNVVETE